MGPGFAGMDMWAGPAHIGNVMDTIDRDTTPKKLAPKPRDKAKVVRSKPVKGEIDHGALTDKIIARFPKILKALAE
jgi:hypothetical protein